MKIAIGCDEAACGLKEAVRKHLTELGHEVEDFGTDGKPVLYPDIAVAVAEHVAQGKAERGMLFCGTGIGMCISANKVPGIRAAVCHDPYSTERSRKSNDAQILCMGARVIGQELALYLITLWLGCDFSGGGSQPKVERMNHYDEQYRKETL